MKKFFTSAVLLAMLVVLPAQAQSVKFGVKGGYNITDMKFDKTSTAKSTIDMGKKNKNGWFIGPTLKASLIGGLGIDGAVLYDQRETTIDEETMKQQYVNVPINLRYNIGLGGLGGIYLGVGPQFGFNVGDKNLTLKSAVEDTDGAKSTVNDTFQLKKSTFGVNLGAGVYLLKFLEVGFAYNIPLGNTADLDRESAIDQMKETYDVKSNTWQVSAAIYF